jgi:hypothetical protein
MPATEAQIRANQQNAAKSTGPKTLAGKEQSRQNGLKHGLSGAGVVVSREDFDETEQRTSALEADLQPRSPLGLILVRQMALLSVRMERSARQESAAIAGRVRNAIEEFDEVMLGEAEALLRELAEEPRRSLRKLRQFPEGIDRLIQGWDSLRDRLKRQPRPNWSIKQTETMGNLLGIRAEEISGHRIEALARAIDGDLSGLNEQDGAGLDDLARRGWARDQLLARIDAEIAALEQQFEDLDFETIALDRSQAPDRALCDTSREATLARRYEAEARRSFFKALKEFRQVEAEFLERQKPVENEPELASSCARKSPIPRDPIPTPPTPLPRSDRASLDPKMTTNLRDRGALIPS